MTNLQVIQLKQFSKTNKTECWIMETIH